MDEQNETQRKFEYQVQRDVWTSEGERIRKGTIATLTAEEAQDGVEDGTLKRIKAEERAD